MLLEYQLSLLVCSFTAVDVIYTSENSNNTNICPCIVFASVASVVVHSWKSWTINNLIGVANNCACSRGREAAFSLLLADANHCYSIENNGGGGVHHPMALFTQRFCITPQCSFANLLHFFVHTEPSSSVIKLHQWVNSYSMSAPQPQNARRYIWWRWDLFFLFFCQHLLQYPPVNLNMY